jgi:RNA polymerase sigma-70 factor (ECF subfamily)
MQACVQELVTHAETDRAIAARLARGEARAIDAFYREHCDAIYAFVFFRVGRSREDAEDVAAETFLLALKNIGGYEGRAPLGVWLRGIARNKCRERVKAKARRRLAGGPEPVDLDALPDLEGADLPQRVIESEETAAAVTAALSQIPPHYKRVLLSKYVDEKTFAEIAAAEESSPKAVESMIQRAKGAFARIVRVMHGRDRTRVIHG